jgi:GT2 family glycosyltransferase
MIEGPAEGGTAADPVSGGAEVAAGVPAVVAVLVTRDPGPWFEETLSALAAQDYGELSVLVLVSGGTEDPTPRIASVLPDAFVRRLDDDRGFGAAADEVLSMVEGAAFFLLCHDDCVPEPDAVHLLVEESFRSNAGIVGPKMLRWEDPSLLLHVGMNVDKTGAVVERVLPGEIDHGQHDAVRDVFMVPGGFTLVRADLFAELGGYDPGIVAMGEDLDLCWRAQVAGSRVVVVPDARVRHLEAVAGGLRPVADVDGEGEVPTLQALQRRHELRSVLVCYGFFNRVRVIPQALLLAAGEIVVSLLIGDRERVRAVGAAWWWNLGRRKEIRRRRTAVAAHRALSDHEVRVLQLHGSARLSTYASRLIHQDLDAAHGRVVETAGGPRATGATGEIDLGDGHDGLEPVLTGSVGLAFSENADFDELDDLGHRSGRDRHGRRRRRTFLSTRRSRLAAWLVIAVILVVGSRDVVGGSMPLIGQFLPFPSWTGAWHQFVAGWQPAGLGTTAPATPAYGILGVLGTVTFGGMGFLQKVLVFGCIPVGAWGVSRLLRPLASRRASLVAGIAYVALPLPYDDLARGRWDGLVAYAAIPWIMARLMRASRMAPFEDPAEGGAGEWWRTTLVGESLVIGVIEAVAVAFAPAVAIAVLLCAIGVFAGSYAVGEWRRSWRVLAIAGLATVVTLVLCAPWVIGILSAGRGAWSVFGLTGSPQSSPSWADLIRFAVGPVGGSFLGWFLVAAALLPLLIGREFRLSWAGRAWTVACLSWIVALAVARGWTGSWSPSVDVVLAPAAVAVAVGVGLGVRAFEADLSDYHFGWRQVVGALALGVAAIGVLPLVAAAGGGRWGLVTDGYSGALGSVGKAGSTVPTGGSADAPRTGAFRVLWLGDPQVLPLGGWSVAPGLAYATSEVGGPGPADLWAPASPGPAASLASSVQTARDGDTHHLGRLLAPASIRYVVVVSSLAPVIAGVQSAPVVDPPPDLVPALEQQVDLAEVPSAAGGYTVFENTVAIPERAGRPTGPVEAGAVPSGPSASDVTGWEGVLPGAAGSSTYGSQVAAGTVYASYAPAGRWHLTVDGTAVAGHSAFGWASQWAASPGKAILSVDEPAVDTVGALGELVVWVVVLCVVVGTRWTVSWWWRPLSSRVGALLRPARRSGGSRRTDGNGARKLRRGWSR